MKNNKDNQAIHDENSVFAISVISVLGDRREQQDRFGYSLKNDEVMMVICDGMGGHAGGALAGTTAVNMMLAAYEESYPCGSPETMFTENAKNADKNVAALMNDNGKPLKAGSTMVAVIVREKSLYWCSVGDSRAYLFRQGEFVQLTKDQNYRTVLEEKLSADLITKREYDEQLKRGEMLISYLGIGNLSLIDYNNAPLKTNRGDKIVVMTDGLYRLVSDDEISRIVDNFSNIDEALPALEMKAARNAKNSSVSRDNMTVAIIKIK